jgi:hypothetical protein
VTATLCFDYRLEDNYIYSALSLSLVRLWTENDVNTDDDCFLFHHSKTVVHKYPAAINVRI